MADFEEQQPTLECVTFEENDEVICHTDCGPANLCHTDCGPAN